MTYAQCAMLCPGDKVLVRDDAGDHDNFVNGMYDYGPVLTVRLVLFNGDGIRVEEDDGRYYWNAEMLDPYEEPEPDEIEAPPDLSVLF